MMNVRNGLLLVAAISAVTAFSAAEAKQGWAVIAEQQVGKGGDVDTVQINNPRKFQSVRICVYGRAVHLNSFSVQFRNGGRQDLDVRTNYRPGKCSRAVDLKGEKRHIEWVMLNYNRRPGDGAPVVRIEAK
jgi:hypothetical protein